MKKIYYLFAFALLGFTACQKEPLLHSVLPSEIKTLTITLQKSDYAYITGYPSSTLTIDDNTDAQKYIPMVLNAEYANLDNGSKAAVTYAQSALYFKPAKDSLYTDVAYTLTSSDYLLLPGNKYSDFSVSQVLAWLPYKYPTPVANELKLITFTPYPSTLTPPPPYSFMYYNGKWQQVYTVQPAQYTTVGLGKYDQFGTANDATLPSVLAAFLDADITISDTAKTGDIDFVSYDYFASNDTAYQRVQPLEYNGIKWTVPQTSTVTANFIKLNGVWAYVQPLPVIAHTINAADVTLIANSTVGSGTERTNLGKYGDFSSWASADLTAAFTLVLTTDYPTPAVNTNYEVTYLNYTGGADVPTVVTFQWSGTAWVQQAN
jgi:hypothetical protein